MAIVTLYIVKGKYTVKPFIFTLAHTRITTGDTWTDCKNKVLKVKSDEIQRGSERESQVTSLVATNDKS